MEPTTFIPKRMTGLFHSNQIAAFDCLDHHETLASRVAKCVERAFHAIGTSSATQEIVYLNLYTDKNVGRNEVLDKPEEFLDGLRDIFGEAATVVFEYMATRELAREFGLGVVFDRGPNREGRLREILHSIVNASSNDGRILPPPDPKM